VKDLHNENYETVKKEIQEDTEHGMTFHVHGSAELMFNATIKIPVSCFTEIEKSILKFI
jgi:hypothetical protein